MSYIHIYIYIIHHIYHISSYFIMKYMLQIFVDLWGTILILWRCILSITLQLIRRKFFTLDKENGKRSNVYRFCSWMGGNSY